MRVAVKHHGVVRHHEDTARRQLKEYDGPIGGQVIFLRIFDLSETARYESLSAVGESRVWFASKNLTPCRMH